MSEALWPGAVDGLTCSRAFERLAVPFAEVGGGLVGAAEEVGEDRVRVRCAGHRLVRQHLLTAGLVVEPGASGVALRLGVGVRVEGALLAATRPESAAGQLVRIILGHDRLRAVRPAARVMWGDPAG